MKTDLPLWRPEVWLIGAPMVVGLVVAGLILGVGLIGVCLIPPWSR
jgi:hypothetical protein